jgi:hypothetical protein
MGGARHNFFDPDCRAVSERNILRNSAHPTAPMVMADTPVTPASINPSMTTSNAITIENASTGLTRTMPTTAEQASHARTLAILVIPIARCPRAILRTKRKRVVDRGWSDEPPAKRGHRIRFRSATGQNWIGGSEARGAVARPRSHRGGFLHPVSPDPPKPDLLVGGVNSRVGWTAVLRLDLSGWRGWRRAVIWIAVAKSTFDPTRNSVALNLRLMDGLRTPIYMPAPDGGRRNLTNRRKLLHQHCHDRELLRPTGRQAKTAFGGAQINADRERPGAGQTWDR